MNPSSSAKVVDELNIIERLQRRDTTAMAELYDSYGRIVYSVALRILGDTGAAEDAVQETFLRVWTRAHLIDHSRSSLAPWLVTVARNLSIDCLRAARDHGSGKEPALSDSFRSQRPFDIPNSIDRSRAMQELSHEQRQAIELGYFEGLSQREISVRMVRPLGTVKTWMRTALAILRKTMDHQSSPESKIVSASVRTFQEASTSHASRDAGR